MNIYAKPGSQVKVTGDSFNNGLTEDRVDIANQVTPTIWKCLRARSVRSRTAGIGRR